MNDMQMSVLNLLQQSAAAKVDSKPQTKDKDDREFRDLMSQAESQTKEPETKDSAVPQEPKAEEQELDTETMQALAAMQLFCVDSRQVVTTEVPVPEQQIQAAASPAVAVVVEETGDAPEAPKPVQHAVQTEVPAKEQSVPRPQQTVEAVEAQPEQPKTQAPVAQEQEIPVEQKQSQSKTEAVQEVKADKGEQKLPEEVPDEAQGRVFREVETAPVKVSETTAEPEAPKSLENQVKQGLSKALAKGETRAEIQLTPEHLGKITIEVTRQENGAMHIVLHAESSQTKTLLERDLPHMQQLLMRDTQQDIQMEVRSQQETQQKEFYDGHRQQEQQHQQQEQHRQQERDGDFLNQLRLGLIDLDDAVS